MKENINHNETSCQSQASKILDWMLRGHRINPLQALDKFGCFRLPARVADLKKKGWPIQSEFITTSTGKRVKCYWI